MAWITWSMTVSAQDGATDTDSVDATTDDGDAIDDAESTDDEARDDAESIAVTSEPAVEDSASDDSGDADEEDDDEPAPPAHRPYEGGQGRGLLYGSYLISPYYLTDVRRSAGLTDQLLVGAGGGVHARLGWEFPLGFMLELRGGLAGSGVDTQGVPGVNTVFLRGDVGLVARYLFNNDTIFVPFIEAGGGLRLLFFDWSTDPTPNRTVSGAALFAMHAAVGAHLELTPYFGIEAGLALDYTFGLDVFEEGLVSLMPFLGVTLYLEDENDRIF